MNWKSSLKLTLLDEDEEIELPVGSDRGVRQTLEPIDGGAEMRRTVNGDLVILRNAAFEKYRTEISASDLAAPALGGVWTGDRVRVHCVARIWERLGSDGTVELSRKPVKGSVVATSRADGSRVPVVVDGRSVSAPGASSVSYRPILDCAITRLSTDEEEMTVATSWSLSLEEL